MGKCGMLPDYEQMTDEEIARLAQAGDVDVAGEQLLGIVIADDRAGIPVPVAPHQPSDR